MVEKLLSCEHNIHKREQEKTKQCEFEKNKIEIWKGKITLKWKLKSMDIINSKSNTTKWT